MDTRWKNSKGGRLLRLFLFFTIIASLSLSVVNLREFLIENEDNLGIIFEENYMNNDKYYSDRDLLFSDLRDLVTVYKNKNYIKEGRSIDMYDVINHELPPYYGEFVDSEDYIEGASEEENFERFKKLYPEEVALAKEDIIKSHLQTFNNIRSRIDKLEGISYYATNGRDVFTNAPMMKEVDYLKEVGYFMYDYDNGVRSYPRDQAYVDSQNYGGVKSNFSSNNRTKIYIGFSQKYFNDLEEVWLKDKARARDDFQKFLLAFVLMLLAFFLEILLLPNKEEEGERLIDKPYTDLAALASLLLIGGFLIFLSGSEFINKFLVGIVTALMGSLGLYLVLSMVRNIKNGRFFEHSLLGKVFKAIKVFFVEIYRGSSFEKKIVILVIIYPILLGLTVFIFPVTIGLIAWMAFRRAKDFSKIRDGVRRVKEGDLSHKIDIERDGEFKDLAEDINSISEGLDQAIDNELRSERHKAELITNVSHDIRTPLTSIITYIDLLKKEEDPEKVKNYLEVLEAKSARLKTLTDDLFEASKVSSGNIPVSLSKIDVVSLLKQGLGEVNDRIEDRKLDFIVKADLDDIYARADGDLLWRAIENLLSNIFKYSLEGSRVYINIEDLGEDVSITMKNISAYSLNISVDELLKRFKRGDESRSSEGSGLGLSIAESLIEVQNGRFELEIDGDLFKTRIVLPKYKEG